MLDDLVRVIETLQRRIRDHGATLRENETRTRMALIDPLLSALGWDVSEPSAVTAEYGIGDDFVDYALLGPNNLPVALVEAKKLGLPLSTHQRQLFGYCEQASVRYGALTDGSNWRLYDLSKMDDKLTDTVAITGGALVHQIVMRLLPLWRPNLASNPPAMPDIPPAGPLRNPRLPEWVELSSFNPPRGARPPAAVRFSDQSERGVKNWRYLLVETVKWLWSNGLLTKEMVPVHYKPNSNRFSVNIKPIHGTGAQFFSQVRVSGTPLFIEGQGGVEMPGRIRSLLEHCGVSPDTVHLQVGE